MASASLFATAAGRLDSLFLAGAELSHDFIAVTWAGALVFVNAAGARLLRMPPEAARGMPLSALVVRHDDAARLAAGPREPVVVTLCRQDGSWLDLEVSCTPVDCDGLDAQLLVGREVAAMCGSQQARWRERQLAGIVETMAEGLITIDREGLILSLNPAAERIFGWPAGALLGRRIGVLMPDEQSRRHDAALAAYLARRTPHIIGQRREVTGRHRDGRDLPLELTVTELSLDGERLFIGTIRDLTEAKRTEAEHQLMREQFTQSQKMEAVAQLAAGMAHDFNNIITAMVACAESAMSRLPPDSEACEDLSNVYTAGMRAGRIAEQLLSFAQPNVGEVRPVRLDLVAGEACALVRASLPRRVALTVTASPCSVMADDMPLYQVITNLCVNAAHAIGDHSGRITVSVDRVDAEQVSLACPAAAAVAPVRIRLGTPPPGRLARLSVADTGCGMSAELLQRIFEPFFSTRAAGGGGSGLGLAAVHGLVTGLGGSITVESVEGRGSTFTIVLPSA